MKEITLYELLNNLDDLVKFTLSEKLKIYIVTTTSLRDRLTANVEQYYLCDIPLYLLRKKVFKVYHFENAIEILE